MRERLFTLLCAAGALALFFAMFVRREGGFNVRNDVARPTTAERRGDGYSAAFTWLNAEHTRAISLRQPFDKLAEIKSLPPSGNLLIVTLPAFSGFKTEELVPLDRWIRAGNTLLVLAALSDNPAWAFSSSDVAPADLNLLTGLEFETTRSRDLRLRGRPPPAEDSRALVEPGRTALVPNRAHPYFNNVNEAIALSDYTAHPWTVKVPYRGFVLALGRQRETGEGVFWTRPLGEGRIVVSGAGSIFTNRALSLANNAQLLANIVGANVKEGGAVLFDDAHQGLGPSYDPAEFFKDRRLYATVAIFIGLWLVWVLGSTRLRVPTSRIAIPREAELVRASGGFLARVLPTHAAAQRLFDHFFRRVNAHAQRHGGGPPWDLLERQSRVAAHDLRQLKDWYAKAFAAQRVPLVRLYNLILRIDRQIA